MPFTVTGGGPIYKVPGIIRPEDRTPVGGTIPNIGGSFTPTTTVPSAYSPTTVPFGIQDQRAPKIQSANAGNLAYRPQIPQLENPPLQPPVPVSQRNNTQIMLPDAYRQNTNGMYPPLTIRNGITMPSATPGVKPQSFPGMNWADFLTVAHNSY